MSGTASGPLGALLRRPVVLVALVLAIAAGVFAGVQVRAHQAADRRAAAELVAEQEADKAATERRAEAERRAQEAEAAELVAELAEAERARDEAVVTLEAALASAREERTRAEEALVASEGDVAEDAVRVALVAAMEAVDAEMAAAAAELEAAALEAAGLEAAGTTADDVAAHRAGEPGALDADAEAVAEDLAAFQAVTAALAPEALVDAVDALGEARSVVIEAQAAWDGAPADRAEAETAKGSEDGVAEPTGSTHPSGLGGPPSSGAGPDCGGPESREPPRNDGSPVFYTSTPAASGDGSNGRMSRDSMAPLGWCTDGQGNQQWLRADAAAALTRLNTEFRAEFGENIAVDLSYRSYADQVEMREWYGSVAARPGTSNHGFGTAFDVWEWEAYGFGSARYVWLVENGPRFGWVAPTWARADGSNPEYWHFEYTG